MVLQSVLFSGLIQVENSPSILCHCSRYVCSYGHYRCNDQEEFIGHGQALIAALIGVIIASVVNMFLQSSGMSFIISLISVVIFAGLIAYDNQRIRYVFEETGGEVQEGWAISLALQLYLDFVNLFLNLLRVLGRRD